MRIPRKNIVKVAGKPLIYYSIREAKKSKLLDAFIVSTDDPEIAEVAKSFGADVPFLRPKNTARKFSAEIEYQQHALKWLEKNRGWKPELVILIKPTSPLRSASVIDEVIEFALENKRFTMVTTISKPSFHPHRMAVVKEDGKTLDHILPNMVKKEDYDKWGFYTPTQKLTSVYALNTLVDAIPAKLILKGTKAVFKGPFGGIVTDPSLSIDIDHKGDLDLVEYFLRKRKIE